MNDEIQTAAAWKERICGLEERRGAARAALAELGGLRGRVAMDIELGRLPMAELEKPYAEIQSRRLELELVAFVRPRRDPSVQGDRGHLADPALERFVATWAAI